VAYYECIKIDTICQGDVALHSIPKINIIIRVAQNTRDKIIDTVIRLYSQYSYEEISTTQIIDAVGISKGTLYWHFKTKEDMFDAAFDKCYKKTLEYTRMNMDDNAPVIDCLKRRLKNLTILNKTDPFCMQVLIKHIPVIAKQKHPVPYGEFNDDLAKYTKKGLQNNEIIDLPENFIVHTIFFINSGFIRYLNMHPQCYESETLIDKMIDSLFKSIQP